jgi:hypothetical protein
VLRGWLPDPDGFILRDMGDRCRLLLIVASVAIPSVLAGCGAAEPTCVRPVSGTAGYTASSVPPPYHVEWTLTFDGRRGHLEVTPGYGAPERWAADFAADETRVEAACRALAAADQQDRPPPGAAVVTADLRAGDGSTLRRTTAVTPSGEVYATLKATVPTSTWDETYGAYETWSRGQ